MQFNIKCTSAFYQSDADVIYSSVKRAYIPKLTLCKDLFQHLR